MGINRVAISGNLTRDPEVRRTQSGMAIMTVGVAVNDRRKNPQTGEWEDYPNFVDCTMFGERADKVAAYLNKGIKVAIEGKLRYSSWEKDGQKKSKLEVIIEEIEWFAPKQQNGQQGGYPTPQQGGYPTPQQVGYQQQQMAQGVAQMQAANMQYQQMAQPQYAPQPAPMPQYAQQPNYGQMPVTQAVPQAVANVAGQQPQYAPQAAPQPMQPQAAPQAAPQPAQMAMPVQQPMADTSVYDDDIPF